MKPRFIVAAALLGAAGVVFAQDKPVTIKIAPQNGSKESGTAKLTPQGADKTKVDISLRDEPKGIPQPAHIHLGSCANLDPKPKHGLENVVNGKSSTVVPVGLEELMKEHGAINVHKSTKEIKTYVACGDLNASAK